MTKAKACKGVCDNSNHLEEWKRIFRRVCDEAELHPDRRLCARCHRELAEASRSDEE